MKLFIGIVISCLCVNFLKADKSYRVGLVQDNNVNYIHSIYEAGKKNVDLLVLPSLEPSRTLDNYEETVQSLSKASKQAGLYLVANLAERVTCQNQQEEVRSNLVFDREGSIIADYRKPMNSLTNCTSTPSELVSFTTDFGVSFGLLMEEDLLLRDVQYMKGLKNFIATGGWPSDIPFMSAVQFSSSWAYATSANLVTSSGIYYGKTGATTGDDELVVTDLHKDGGSVLPSASIVQPTHSFSAEDLTQYIIKPLELEASTKDYKETVCHGSFCCEFYIKTGVTGRLPGASYGLAAFDGVLRFGAGHKIGAQNCVLFACTGVNQKYCSLGSTLNNTDVLFEKITVSANYTKENVQYPIIQLPTVLPIEKFSFETKTEDITKQVTLEVIDTQNVQSFGIFGRDFSKDFVSIFENNEKNEMFDIYDIIFNEDVQEFFDYVWIRLRILLVVVSIYVLEMM